MNKKQLMVFMDIVDNKKHRKGPWRLSFKYALIRLRLRNMRIEKQ